MSHRAFLSMLTLDLAGLCLLAAPTVRPAEAPSNAEPETIASTWQHHKITFSYEGFTTAYTCDGLEDRVKSMFLQLGARKDMTIHTGACPGGPDTPSHMILVSADFYTLAPVGGGSAADTAAQGNTVQARWQPLKFEPWKPRFMADGDCELMQSMKDVIEKNFALRDVQYRTDCVPHEIFLNSYSVKAQTLKAAEPGGTAKN
ncbi:MAG TPA: hypothetical protein VHV81_16995 [Steroidobacteraceae bacterium]|nr:hypothetical protein [Steroidobacteraceae bacterium]